MVRRTLGPYHVVARLGEGGILPDHLAADPLAGARFEREGQPLAALSHPNLVSRSLQALRP